MSDRPLHWHVLWRRSDQYGCAGIYPARELAIYAVNDLREQHGGPQRFETLCAVGLPHAEPLRTDQIKAQFDAIDPTSPTFTKRELTEEEKSQLVNWMPSCARDVSDTCPASETAAPGLPSAKRVVCKVCGRTMNALHGKFPPHVPPPPTGTPCSRLMCDTPADHNETACWKHRRSQ